jgi:hypothetical protein
MNRHPDEAVEAAGRRAYLALGRKEREEREAAGRSQVVEPTFSDLEQQAQHEKNLRILKLIRDDPAWALSRILLLEQVEAERDQLRERDAEYRERLIEAAQDMARLREFNAATRAAWGELFALHPQEGDGR